MACSPKISRAPAQLNCLILFPAINSESIPRISRIEEMVVLTPDGVKIISLYSAKELPVANRY